MNFKQAIAQFRVTGSSEEKYMAIANRALQEYTDENFALHEVKDRGAFPIEVEYNVFGDNGKREVKVIINKDGTTEVQDEQSDLDSLHNDIALREDNDPDNLRHLANRFHNMVKGANSYFNEEDAERDPLFNKREMTVSPEITEDIEEKIKDSLHIIILLERAFQAYHSDGSEEGTLARRAADHILDELSQMTEKLSDPSLLKFDVDAGSGMMDELNADVDMIRQVLKYSWEELSESIPKERIEGWLAELDDNFSVIVDHSIRQSDYMEYNFMEPETRMLTQDHRHPDELSEEDLHPDIL